MNDMKLQLSKQMRQKHLLVNLMGGDSTANTCQQALTSGDPMQGCPLSGKGFTAALVAIDKDVFWDPVFEWGGHLEDKSGASGLDDSSTHILLRLSRWIWRTPHLFLLPPEGCGFMFRRFAGSPGSPVWFFSWSHCRWPSGEMAMQRSTLSYHIREFLAAVLKLGLHVLQVFRLSCLNASRNFSFTLPQTTRDTCQLQLCLEGYGWHSDASVCMCWLWRTPERSNVLA